MGPTEAGLIVVPAVSVVGIGSVIEDDHSWAIWVVAAVTRENLVVVANVVVDSDESL